MKISRKRDTAIRRSVSRNSIISGQQSSRSDRIVGNWIGSICKLSLEPGDTLVVSVNVVHYGHEGVDALQRMLARHVPPGVTVLVKSNEVGLSVIASNSNAKRAEVPACNEQGTTA